MSRKGVPLGFLDAQCWARDPREFGKKAQRHALPIQDKESYRWIKSCEAVAAVQKRNPQIAVVSMGDREADIYELFEQALRDPDGPKLRVRAKHNRELQDEQERMFETIQAKPITGYQLVKLPRQKARAAREAIYHVTKLGREVPDLPADIFFDQDECKVLVAKFGGFLGRKSDAEPGTETLWRGLQRLDGMTEGWRLANP